MQPILMYIHQRALGICDHTESREHITSGGSHTLPNIDLKQYTDGTLAVFDSATNDSFLFLTALGWPPAAVALMALG